MVWVTPTPPGNRNGSVCAQAALLRSDANGWVKMDGPKGTIIDYFQTMIPDYEPLKLIYEVEPSRHTVHQLNISWFEFSGLPAWSKSLRDLGYMQSALVQDRDVVFRKTFDHLPKTYGDPWSFTGKQRYYVKLRSFPSEAASSISDFAQACGPEGVNFGLSQSTRIGTNPLRAKLKLKILCDERWDSATGRQAYGALTTALWLVGGPENFQNSTREFAERLPNYPKIDGPSADRAFTKTERLAFCAWLQPYADKVPRELP